MFHGKQYNGNAFNVNKQTPGYWLDDFKTSNASGKTIFTLAVLNVNTEDRQYYGLYVTLYVPLEETILSKLRFCCLLVFSNLF